MKKTAFHWLRRSLVLAAAAVLAACINDAPVAPRFPSGIEGSAVAVMAGPGLRDRNVDLGTCTNLQVPEGSKLAFRAYARGVQIYHWNGTSWSFDGPSAVLFADIEGNSIVGSHYFGPTWEMVSGGKVIGSVVRKCTPDANSIPWLRLSAVSDGPGVLSGVTHILRVSTSGGNAPSYSGSVVGEAAEVPYSTVYLFYRD